MDITSQTRAQSNSNYQSTPLIAASYPQSPGHFVSQTTARVSHNLRPSYKSRDYSHYISTPILTSHRSDCRNTLIYAHSLATPRPLYPRETPGTHFVASWVGPRAGLDGCRKSPPPSPPNGIRCGVRGNLDSYSIYVSARVWPHSDMRTCAPFSWSRRILGV